MLLNDNIPKFCYHNLFFLGSSKYLRAQLFISLLKYFYTVDLRQNIIGAVNSTEVGRVSYSVATKTEKHFTVSNQPTVKHFDDRKDNVDTYSRSYNIKEANV